MTSKVLPFRTSPISVPEISVNSQQLPIISVGKDKELLDLREQLLSHEGYIVRSLTPGEAEACGRAPQARLWIFCSTVDLVQLVYLACSVRRYSPASKLLLLEGIRPAGFEASLFHRVIGATGIDSLLTAIHALSVAA